MSKLPGRWAEDLAVQYLAKRGYQILERNFRTRGGEIDIIARHQGITVFVEVKQRRTNKYGYPWESVNWHKRRKLLHAALLYECPGPKRFDVIAISGPPGQAQLQHFENAFGEE